MSHESVGQRGNILLIWAGLYLSLLGPLTCLCWAGRLSGVWLVWDGLRGDKATLFQQLSRCVLVAVARAGEICGNARHFCQGSVYIIFLILLG